MKRSCFTACVTPVMLALTVSIAAASNRVVAQDGQGTPNNCDAATPTPYTTIAAALADAGVGDKIIVCAGVYEEQVEITKALTISGRGAAIVKPVGVVANSTSLFSGAPIAAIVLVTTTAGNVVIEQLTVDGADNGLTGCEPNLMGIYYRNASGTVKNAVVRNIELGAGLEGCQSGNAIFVQSGGAGTSNVLVTGTSVHDYQKNGITGNEAGTTLTATNNIVTGWGPTPDIAQNGIQIAFGAAGTVRGNRVINHIWTPCVSVEACAFASMSILVTDAANGVTVSGNTIGTSQVGIYFDVDGGSVTSNLIQDTQVFDGIFIFGDGNQVLKNQAVDSDESGIWVMGDDNIVQRNTINEAPIGIVDDGAGNVISTSGSGRNIFYNVGTNVAGPPAVAVALSVPVAGRASGKPAR